MEAFADIEGPVRLGLPLWLILAAGILIFACSVSYLIWRRRKKGDAPMAQAAPARPPRELAMERLQELRDRMASIAAEPFTVEVSAILRDFIEAQFRLPAREQTTEEFLSALGGQDRLPPVLKEKMPAFLENCDRVKFARQALAEAEREELLETGKAVIEAAEPETTPDSLSPTP